MFLCTRPCDQEAFRIHVIFKEKSSGSVFPPETIKNWALIPECISNQNTAAADNTSVFSLFNIFCVFVIVEIFWNKTTNYLYSWQLTFPACSQSSRIGSSIYSVKLHVWTWWYTCWFNVGSSSWRPARKCSPLERTGGRLLDIPGCLISVSKLFHVSPLSSSMDVNASHSLYRCVSPFSVGFTPAV